jgi:geranylgeranyl diphosphate synthase type I
LIALTCQAAHGNPNATHETGAAIVLLTAAADIHDDIIDKSKTKAGKPTALGKFGQDAALLAGDALLFKGTFLLHKACQNLSSERRQAVLDSVEHAFFEIGNASISALAYEGKRDLPPEEYLKVINAKAAISEACAHIGTAIAGGSPQETVALTHYGRVLGTLMTLRNELADLTWAEELRNRAKNETLPFPLLCALQDNSARKQLVPLLEGRINSSSAQKIAELTLKTTQVQTLLREMRSNAEKEKTALQKLSGDTEPLQLLLRLAVEDI